jgi:Ni/Fe-hydrogenase b-type cytochrome subunit
VLAILLAQVNVWLDVVFFPLYGIVLVFLGIHFLGNILTGRAYKRFVKWQWPEHEGAPVPALPKFMHFQHLVCIGLLVLSGMYIRFPYFTGGRSFMRYVHYIAMIVVSVNLFWRIWYALFSRARDYREFVPTKRDITTALTVIMYYVFIKPSKPHLGRYNVLQKVVYICFIPMLLVQIVTGLGLLTQTVPIIDMSMRQLVLGWWLGPLVGGTAMAGAWARIVHYAFNWLFILFVTIHIYLSLTEDFAAFLSFFGLGFLDKRHAGEHDAGHAEDHAAPDVAAPALTEAD